MALKIGHRSRNRQTPHNRGMSRRADRRLLATADSFVDKFETSLRVDGVFAGIFNVEQGTKACTCRGKSEFGDGLLSNSGTESTDTIVTVNEDDDGNVTRSTVTVGSGSSPDEVIQGGTYEYVGSSLTRGDLDDYFSSKYIEETTPERIEQDSEHVVEFYEETGQRPDQIDLMDAFLDDGEVRGGDSIATMDDDGDPLLDALGAGEGFGNPEGLLTPTQLACAVCHGYGYVDALRLYNGSRIVLHAGSSSLVLGGTGITEDRPARLDLFDKSPVYWKAVRLPPMWKHLVRLGVHLDGAAVTGVELFYKHSSSTVLVPLTFDTLKALNGSTELAADPTIDIYVQGLTNMVTITHVEILIMIGELPVIQVPELSFVNESQFVDWNLNADFEISSKVRLKPNSFVTEAKYDRIWKVVSVERKSTANGIAYGYKFNARALHPYEKTAVLLRMFGAPIDPFDLDLEDGDDDDLEI